VLWDDQVTARLGVRGVLVHEVVENGPAAQAGIQPTRRSNRPVCSRRSHRGRERESRSITRFDLYRILDQFQGWRIGNDHDQPQRRRKAGAGDAEGPRLTGALTRREGGGSMDLRCFPLLSPDETDAAPALAPERLVERGVTVIALARPTRSSTSTFWTAVSGRPCSNWLKRPIRRLSCWICPTPVPSAHHSSKCGFDCGRNFRRGRAARLAFAA